MRNNKALVVSVAALIVFVVFAMVSIARIDALETETEEYRNQNIALHERTTDYDEVLKRSATLIEENAELIEENIELSIRNNKLSADNKELETENDELSAANSELERLNGDLLKKFDGLSRPN